MVRTAGTYAATLLLALASCLAAVDPALAQSPPTVVVLATGGTIAGAGAGATQAAYASAQLGVDRLIAAVPDAGKLATLRGEQVASVGSQDMSDTIWLALARRVDAVLADPAVAGVVITHGTDTLEETATFLDLVLTSPKPVVLTAAMRPATALSADGPLNFYNAVAVAASPASAGRGVLVVINDEIHGAPGVTKSSTTAVDTFVSPTRGLLGTVTFGAIEFFGDPRRRPTAPPPFSLGDHASLPRVDIVYAHAGMDATLIDAAVAAGARGIVVAGVGNGNLSAAALEALGRAARRGVLCVRSSRVQHGAVARNVEVDDDGLGLLAADELNPQKARVLLKLALLAQVPPAAVQRLFATY
jgi:L-asparaginase